MADSIADLLTGSVLQSGQKTGDLAGSIAQGAGLAQQIEQTQLLRQQIEKQKQDMEFQKISKIGEWYDHATKMPEGAARKAFMQNFIPAGIQALGMEKKIDPTVVKMIEAEPSVVGYLKDKLERRELNMSDLQQALVDPAMMAQLMEKTALGQFGGEQALKGALTDYQQTLAKAGTTGVAEAGKFGRAELAAVEKAAEAERARKAAGQVAFSKNIGEEAGNYIARGGKASAVSSVDSLANVISKLKEGKDKTGKLLGWAPDAIKTLLDPDVQALRNDAESAMDSMLKVTLGPQFTEQEGLRQLRRIWDDRQPVSENIRRVERKMNELKMQTADKEKEFIKGGYMKENEAHFYKPSGGITTKQKELYKKAKPELRQQMIQAIMKQLSIVEDKARKMLEE